MIQDIFPHIYHNEYCPSAPDPSSVLLFYQNRSIFARLTDGQISYLTFDQAEGRVRGLYTDSIYLFSIDCTKYYLARWLDPALFASEGYAFYPASVLRTVEDGCLAFAGITGCQLADWYSTRKFCSRCGSPLSPGTTERSLCCPDCGLIEYPKICPAVIVGITNGDQILMSKYAGREYKRYALIAGYAEIGETLEETVHREVLEEVGLHVKNIRYYKSQPWSFSDTLLMGFFCDLDGSPDILLDRNELALAEWVNRSDIPEEEAPISLTGEMMQIFRIGNEPGRSLSF